MPWRKGESGNKKGRPVKASNTSLEASQTILSVSKKLPKHLQLLALAMEDSKWFHEKIYPLIFRPGVAVGLASLDQSQHLSITFNELPANERCLIKEVIDARVAMLTRSVTQIEEPLQIGGPRPPQSGTESELTEESKGQGQPEAGRTNAETTEKNDGNARA